MFGSQNLKVKQRIRFVHLQQLTGSFETVFTIQRRRVYHKSQTNKDNLLCEWKRLMRHGRAQTVLGRGSFQSGATFVSFGRTWWLDLQVQVHDFIQTKKKKKSGTQKHWIPWKLWLRAEWLEPKKCLIGCFTSTFKVFESTARYSYPTKSLLTQSCHCLRSSWNIIRWRGVSQ